MRKTGCSPKGRPTRRVCLVDNVPSNRVVDSTEFVAGPDSIFELACTVFAELDTPVSLACYLLLQAKEYTQLATRGLSPSDYLDTPSGVEKYRRDAQAVDLLRKFEGLPSSINKKLAAVVGFFEAEELCRRANDRFTLLREEGPLSPIEHAYVGILRRARKWMARALGRVPQDLDFGFGPGTAIGLKSSTLIDKLTTCGTITSDAMYVLPFAERWNGWLQHRALSGLQPEIVPGGRFTTVPKDATKERGIDIQPLFNLGFQLAIGRHLKRRLSMVGLHVQAGEAAGNTCFAQAGLAWSLPNGQDLHREWALRGSLGEGYATIDLSSASDTVSTGVVRALLPSDWFDLLSTFRTPVTEVCGLLVPLEKFSAMGNGYTFELETLVFTALIVGATGLIPGVDFLVYGDDIIVPEDVARDVIAVLRYSGFEINNKKTFTTGFFRESCGGDYFCGVDVRSVFIKDKLTLSGLVDLVNSLCKRGLVKSARAAEKLIPVHLRRYGPVGSPGAMWLPGKIRWNFRDGMRWYQCVVEIRSHYTLERFNIPGWQYHAYLGCLGQDSERVTPPRMPFAEYRSSWMSWT